jgi:hypothetical protein
MARPNRRNPVTDQQIIDAYREVPSAYKVAAQLGLSPTTVERVLAKAGVPRIGLQVWRQSARKYAGQEADVLAVYDAGGTFDDIRKTFGVASAEAIRGAIARAGGTLREDRTGIRIKPGEFERIKELNEQGWGFRRIALEIGRSESFVSHTARLNGIRRQKASGDQHGRWSGGKYKDGAGYIRAWVSPDDPMIAMAHNDSHVPEHRLVVARHLGRPLRQSETVHHINGKKSDNRLENLELRQGRHGKHAVMVCLDCGSHNIGHDNLDTPVRTFPPQNGE